ncbi:peroxisomal membrane protein 2-like [Liolophura sinensis]|uniref:peroxisomal membrane protein 2-like n=1 Tax=Liolophura sinensis TaxID=3198878 RepID=UPI003158D41D
MSERRGTTKNFLEKLIADYNRNLQKRPVLTKAVTSASIAALGDIISQALFPSPHTKHRFWWRSTFAYATFGFLFNGPLIHHFYIWLDKLVPAGKKPGTGIKRVLFDRLILAPPYLLLFFYVVAILEGLGSDVAIQKIRDTFWTALKMNWRIWTVFQYINVNYVPLQYRVLVTNMVSLIWTVYIAAKRRHDA